MQKILVILTSISLLTPTINSIISCNGSKYIPDDDSKETTNDVEIMTKIMDKVSQRFQTFWVKKAIIDINTYPDQLANFQKLVSNLKTNNGEVLTGKAISQWRFLDQLVTAFNVEFANLNCEIANEYSNFYFNTVPLSIEPSDITFNLSHINFDNLAKLITVNNDSIMGITINFSISYSIKFKDLEQPQNSQGLVVICNDVEALSGIQKNLENYFITFIDELFQKQNYEIIDSLQRNFDSINGYNTIWPIVGQELKARGILFKNDSSISWSSFSTSFRLIETVTKSDSVLSWAGSGYDSQKLTPENFLKFYKEKYFKPSL